MTSAPVDLEAEYNNRARVPEHPAIRARWAADAAAFRARHPPEPLAYGPGPRERLDLFLPPGVARPPGVLFVHGGYWQALDRGAVSHFAAGQAHEG